MSVSVITPKTPSNPDDSLTHFRVMVVDDSAVIRGFLVRYLEDDSRIKVVATASNGAMALKTMKIARPDVVVLDIEMPEMDGMTALPKILEIDPTVRVVMASTLTLKNADISLRAIQMGAADYVPKPETTRSVNADVDFRRELVEKVKIYAAARRRALRLHIPGSGAASGGTVVSRQRTLDRGIGKRPVRDVVGEAGKVLVTAKREQVPIVLRPLPRLRPHLLAIAASTGGPQALIRVLTGLKDSLGQIPVLVVQHMPATFTAILADHIGRSAGLPCREAVDKERLKPGHIYVAPGDYHLTVKRSEGGMMLALDQGSPENFCRPAVDPLFRSLSETYGGRALAVVLTGMGHDGLRGARDLVNSGAGLIAQDEKSSVVWGMPGAVAMAGLCSAVVPLDEMAEAIRKVIGEGR